MKYLFLLVLVTSALFLAACSNNPVYLGFFYKNAVYETGKYNEETRLQNAPRFNTLQACHAWGKNLLASKPKDGYECSTGCRIETDWGLICKDTTKMITNNPTGASYDKLF